MIEVPKTQGSLLRSFFEQNPHQLVFSFLQGHMGRALVDRMPNPTIGQINIGDLCFLQGDGKKADANRFVQPMPEIHRSDFMLIIPPNDSWEEVIEDTYRDRFKKYHRWAFKEDPIRFDQKKLVSFINQLPEPYTLVEMDEKRYYQSFEQPFSADFCSQFEHYSDYQSRGIGVCVLYQDQIVSGASSYVVYDDGIEIEIGTQEDNRHRGLALACASQLILSCIKKSLLPHWDAANLASVELAKKLGYHPKLPYITYEVSLR